MIIRQYKDTDLNSVTNWNQKGFPGWVRPCLENYIKANAFDAMIEIANKLKQDTE